MKVSYYSDIHFEFQENPKDFVSKVKAASKGSDVCILAGDIVVTADKPSLEGLKALCDIFPTVLMVPGNHEYYGSNFERTEAVLREIENKKKNYRLLLEETVTVNGVRFLGTTLWFRDTPFVPVFKKYLNDFRKIDYFSRHFAEKNSRAINFLESNVLERDVVISHHLPSNVALHAEYKGSDMNIFYVCAMDRLIENKKPAIWVHGHSHNSHKTNLFDTQILANTYGYDKHMTDDAFEFDASFTV